MLGVWLEMLGIVSSSLLPPRKASGARVTLIRLLSDMNQLMAFLMLEPAE
jgi:hypothetical protein